MVKVLIAAVVILQLTSVFGQNFLPNEPTKNGGANIIDIAKGVGQQMLDNCVQGIQDLKPKLTNYVIAGHVMKSHEASVIAFRDLAQSLHDVLNDQCMVPEFVTNSAPANPMECDNNIRNINAMVGGLVSNGDMTMATSLPKLLNLMRVLPTAIQNCKDGEY